VDGLDFGLSVAQAFEGFGHLLGIAPGAKLRLRQ
jgi:hypothetical protein